MDFLAVVLIVVLACYVMRKMEKKFSGRDYSGRREEGAARSSQKAAQRAARHDAGSGAEHPPYHRRREPGESLPVSGRSLAAVEECVEALERALGGLKDELRALRQAAQSEAGQMPSPAPGLREPGVAREDEASEGALPDDAPPVIAEAAKAAPVITAVLAKDFPVYPNAPETSAGPAPAVGSEPDPVAEGPWTAPAVSVWKTTDPGPATREEAPGFLERAWERLAGLGLGRFLSAGNIWVLGGIGLVLAALVFLVRYAIVIGVLGPELRLSLAAVVGLALLGLGWRHRETRRELGLILQGGGVGALYLTTVAAIRLYELLPQSLAFILLVLIVAFSTALAIVQNARLMAHVAKAAGFLAPVLVSTHAGNHVLLFSYYALLNLAIILVSRYRNWRSLNLTGFVFTSGIGGLWGVERYTPDLFWSVEPFLLVFFVMFTYLALTGSVPTREGARKAALIDVPLTLGTPLIFFFYQATVCREVPFALAFTALGMGFVYLIIARRLWSLSRNGPHAAASSGFEPPETFGWDGGQAEKAPARDHPGPYSLDALLRRGRTLQAETYLAFGLVFANLALPLALYDLGLYNWGRKLLGLFWALEGASLYWLGRRNSVTVFRFFGFLGFGLGLLHVLQYFYSKAWLYFWPFAPEELLTLRRMTVAAHMDVFLSMALHLLGAASLLSAALAARRHPLPGEGGEKRRTTELAFMGAGGLWLYGGYLFELWRLPHSWEWMLLFCVITALGAERLSRRLSWPDLEVASLVPYLPLLALCLKSGPEFLSLLFEDVWSFEPALLRHGVILAFLLFECATGIRPSRAGARFYAQPRLALCLGLLAPALTLETMSLVLSLATPPQTWLRTIPAIWPLVLLACLTFRFAPGRLTPQHRLFAALVPAFLTAFWFLSNLFRLGNPAPLPYLPLFNPLEAGLWLSVALLFLWVRNAGSDHPHSPVLHLARKPAVWMGLAFVLANTMVGRCFALWGGMHFSLSGAMADGGCQAVLAILWGMTGFGSMVHGHRTGQRTLWLGGVCLLLADLAKLFLLDLTHVETLWRIAAFMAVGILLIIIGYRMPLPPGQSNESVRRFPQD